MMLQQVRLLAVLLVVHRGRAFLADHVSDPGKPFQLTVTPALVNMYTTEKMILRCDRNPKVETKIDHIFWMSIVKKSETGWNLVAEQRDNEDSPSVDGDGKASADVTGDISKVFLEVVWDSIGNDSFGVFMCDVMGFDISLQPVMETSSELLLHEERNFKEHVAKLSKETKDTVHDLKKTTKAEISNLKTDLGILETDLSSLQQNVTTDLSSVQKRLASVELFLGSLTKWPGGFYALLQPKSGCPVDLAFFGGTHKFYRFNTETQSSSEKDDHSSAFSRLATISSQGKNFVSLEFCEVTKEFNKESWPAGSFCINGMVSHRCPTGFSDGFAYVDGEDTENQGYGRNSVMSRAGRLVKSLHFCCQDRGPVQTPISLPTASPFLLYRYGGKCQAVQGMTVSEEYVQLNTEDSNNVDNLFRSHPDIDQHGTTLKFHMCYYRKM